MRAGFMSRYQDHTSLLNTDARREDHEQMKLHHPQKASCNRLTRRVKEASLTMQSVYQLRLALDHIPEVVRVVELIPTSEAFLVWHFATPLILLHTSDDVCSHFI